MTPQEELVVNLLADSWNEFVKLEQLHPDDINDFRTLIHALQRIVLSRSELKQIIFITTNSDNDSGANNFPGYQPASLRSIGEGTVRKTS